ncbi:MAG: DUF2232 domain-containing protein [Gemmatimonadales bacterium]
MEARPGRGWPRAAALLGVVLATSTSVVQPGVLIAVPLLVLLIAHGPRRVGPIAGVVLAGVVVAIGSRDGLWYAERAWAVLIGGGFLALSMALPAWSLSARAIGAVAGATGIAAAILSVRTDAWAALDSAITVGVRASSDQALLTLQALGGESASPQVRDAMERLAATQAAVFPAMIAIASMAALGVAWWIRTRLVGEGDQGLAPLRDFRFNDHLVWLLIGGLLLLFVQWGDAFARLGSNAIVFMAALYMLRGAAVFVFLSGGLSMLGYALMLVGLLVAAPVFMSMAVLIGVGDTWLDLRSRVRGLSA